MPIDVSPGSFAAVVITGFFWWTVLSPLGLLAVAALCGSRPRLRGALAIVVLTPPLLTLLPVAVMHGGLAGVAAGVAAALAGVAVALTVAGLVSARARDGLFEVAPLFVGIAGGMLGSVALLGALLFT